MTFKELYNTFGIGGFNEHRGIHKDVLKQHSQQWSKIKQLENPKKGNHAFVERNIPGEHVSVTGAQNHLVISDYQIFTKDQKDQRGSEGSEGSKRIRRIRRI